MSNWIKVEDRLPQPRKAVLVYAPEMVEPITCMYYDPESDSAEFGEWVSEPSGPSRGGWSSLSEADVTHWMPLPEAPSGN
jgi:hypothetical protein